MNFASGNPGNCPKKQNPDDLHDHQGFVYSEKGAAIFAPYLLTFSLFVLPLHLFLLRLELVPGVVLVAGGATGSGHCAAETD